MTILCDVPRHALQVWFGQAAKGKSLSAAEPIRNVELLIDGGPVPPRLVALHFVRGGFVLPPLLTGVGVWAGGFAFKCERTQTEIRFTLGYGGLDGKPLEIFPGVIIHLEGVPDPRDGCPILSRFWIHRDSFTVQWEADQFELILDADILKDTSLKSFAR